MKKTAAPQCQATTLAGTYSAAHRCLKTNGLLAVGALVLCPHHRAFAARAKG